MNLRLKLLAVLAATLGAAPALATPSGIVWIPSTDVQKFGSLHLNYDVYARPNKNTFLSLGPVIGVSPLQLVQAEIGVDVNFQSNEELDKHPFYFHGKLGTPEDGLFPWSPALAVGAYNVGIKSELTDQNLAYGMIARTIPLLGRLSAGYYYGNSTLLGDHNHGLLLAWDRPISELTDKLLLAVDYQGGRNFMGAVNFGVCWAFTPNVTLMAGYDHYLEESLAGKDTFTVQLDINIFPFESRPAPAPSPVP